MTSRRQIRIPVAGRYITPLGEEFASVEALGGIALLFATVAALVWANSAWSASYASFWGHDVTATLGRFSVADDIGAISVIAVFYSSDVQVEWLAGAALTIAVILLMRRAGVLVRLAYLVPALVLWLCVFQSGIHATIAGVGLGLLTPVVDARGRLVVDSLEHRLHPWATWG